MISEGGLIFGGIVLCALLVWALIAAENSEIAGFKQRCIAAGETPAKCAILAEIKRSADDAAMMSGFAVGYSASRR